MLLRLWALCEPIAAREHRRVGNTSTMDVTVAVVLAKRKREACASTEHSNGQHVELGACVGIVSRHPPAKLKRSRLLEGDPRAREKRETAAREHWLVELRGLVEAARLPIVAVAAAASDPAGVMAAVGQGRWASTLRQRVLDWRSAACFFS